jgi:hypothetical protein
MTRPDPNAWVLPFSSLERHCGTEWLIAFVLAGLWVSRVTSSESSGETAAAAMEVAPSKTEVLALPDLENKTGDSTSAHLRLVSPILLGRSLARLNGFELSGGVAWALGQIGLTNGAPLDVGTARSVGQKVGADHVVWGYYERREGGWSVEVRILSVRTGKVSEPISTTSNDLLDIRDRLIDQILKQLKIFPGEAESKSLYARQCASSAALDSLLRAEAQQEELKPLAEIELSARTALESDPRCVPALNLLSIVLARQGKLDE